MVYDFIYNSHLKIAWSSSEDNIEKQSNSSSVQYFPPGQGNLVWYNKADDNYIIIDFTFNTTIKVIPQGDSDSNNYKEEFHGISKLKSFFFNAENDKLFWTRPSNYELKQFLENISSNNYFYTDYIKVLFTKLPPTVKWHVYLFNIYFNWLIHFSNCKFVTLDDHSRYIHKPCKPFTILYEILRNSDGLYQKLGFNAIPVINKDTIIEIGSESRLLSNNE
jgi:hypothetical protein